MMKLVFTDDSGQENQQRVGHGRPSRANDLSAGCETSAARCPPVPGQPLVGAAKLSWYCHRSFSIYQSSSAIGAPVAKLNPRSI